MRIVLEKKRRILGILLFVFMLNFVFAASILDELHLNIQTTDSNGNVITGTFDFVFNISTTSDCNSVIYSDSANLATDSRGIISYYLTDVDLNYDNQYYLCHYRDTVLINSSKISRSPYAFRAKYVNVSGIEVDSNLDLSGFNLTSDYIFGDGSGLTNLNVSSIDLSDYVPYTGATSNLVLGDNNFSVGGTDFFVDADSGTVGIGTTDVNPVMALHVVGQAYISSSFQAANGYLNTAVYSPKYSSRSGNNPILFTNFTDGTELMRIDPSGNVGIGTITPQNTLNVVGDINATGYIYGTFVGDGSQLSNLNLTGVNGSTQWKDSGSDIYYNEGNVGIGTDNPDAKLTINSDGTGYFMKFYASDDGYLGGFYETAGGYGDFLLADTNSVSQIRLRTDGNDNYIKTGKVGIGTATPSHELNVIGDINATGYIIGDGSQLTNLNLSGVNGSTQWLDNGSDIYYDGGNVLIGTGINFGNSKLLVQGGDIRLMEDDGDWEAVRISATTNSGAIELKYNGNTVVKFAGAYGADSWTVNTGNFGIGTKTPQNKLNVVGDANFTGNVTSQTDFCIEGGDCLSDVVASSGNVSGSGTDNYVPLWDGTGSLDSSVIYQNGTNIGIGTTSPNRKLDVQGVFGVQISDSLEGMYVNPTSTGIDFALKDGTGDADFRVDSRTGNEVAWYNGAGNFGIGTDAPTSKLTIGNNGTYALNQGLTFGDGDTGFYEVVDDQIYVTHAGTGRYVFTGASMGSVASYGARIDATGPTATIPGFTFSADADTGIGRAGADELSLVAGGAEVMRLSNTSGTLFTQINGSLNVSAGEDICIEGGECLSSTLSSAGNVSGSGVANRAAFWTGNDELSYDGNFTWDNTNKRLGIGTTIPSSDLEVYSLDTPKIEIQNTASRFFIGINGTGDTGLRITQANRWDTPDIILKSGNVGIGTDSPQSKLHINGTVGSLAGGLTFGDGDTGFYEAIDDALILKVNNVDLWQIQGTSFKAAGNAGIRFDSSTPTSTSPNLMPSNNDLNTGLGWAGADQLSLIAGGVEGIRVQTTGAVVNGNLNVTQNLSVGVADVYIDGGGDMVFRL